MPGSILDEAYEEKRKLEKQERLQALMDDPAYGTPDPAPLTAVDTPPAPEAPEEEVDLWTEAPDRPQRISQKKERVGPSSMGEAFVRDLMAVPGTVAETAPALIPGWQKLFHDSQAFFLENPNGLPRDWQLMSDESEDYFSKFPQPDAGEVTGAMPFRSAAESKVVNKAVKTAQLRAAVQEARLRVALPTSENKFQQGVIDTTFNVGMMAPSMVAGIATKNPVLAVSLMMSQTGMGSYGDARRAGADPTKAYRYGLTMATIEGLTEFMPTKLLIGDMVAKTDFVEAFTKQMVADGLGEQAATHLQDLTTWLELNPDKTLDEFLAERPAAAIRTAIASAMTSTLLSGGTTALSRMMGDKESPAGEPTPEAPPAASEAAPPPEPAPTPEPVPAPADAPAGEAETQTPEQAELLDKVNKVADAIEIAQSQERAPITPQEESEDQRFVRGVESALGIKRPAAPVETAEERRARFSARRADEERQTQESTANVVANVRTFAEARNAAEQTVERAIEEPSPETVVAAVAAQSELAEQTETEPVSLAEAMDVDTTDRTSTMAEAERMAAELEAMDSEDAKSAASTFRTLIQYSDRYDDNTFWQGFDEALEYAAPHLMTETQQAAVIEKVAEAVEAAPLAPEEEASATLVEEVRATAPASRYFGRKSFGGEGLATDMPAAEAAPPAPPAAAPQPARLPPKPAPISNTQLAAITAKEGKLSRPVQAREAMLLKAEDVYDDVLTKDVLTALDDEFDMTERQIREVMGKAIEGRGSLDRFNTLMKRYANVRAGLDREAAQGGVQDDFAALAEAQPDPGEGGLGRGLQSLLDDQNNAPPSRLKRFVEGETWASLWKRVQRFSGRDDASQRYEDAVQDAAIMVASMSPRTAEEALSDARQLGGPAEKAAVDDIRQRVERIRAAADVKFSRNDDRASDTITTSDFDYAVEEFKTEWEKSSPIVEQLARQSNSAASVSEPIQAINDLLKEATSAPRQMLDAMEQADRIADAFEDPFDQDSPSAKLADEALDILRDIASLNVIDGSPSDAALESANLNALLDRLSAVHSSLADFNESDVLQTVEDEDGATEPMFEAAFIDEYRQRLNEIKSLADAPRLSPEKIGEDYQTIAAKMRRNVDELWDAVAQTLRSNEADGSSPEAQALRDIMDAFDSQLRVFSRPRNVLFSGSGTSKRKPVKDAEKNRKRLDAHAYRGWGQNYLDLVQKGLLTYASAEEIASFGLGASGQENALFIPIEGNKGFEVVINTSIVRPEHIEGILLHEVGVHGGLQALMGKDRMDEVLTSLDRLVDSFAQKMQQGRQPSRAEMAAKQARLKAERNSAQPKQVREETLAYIVEDHITNPLMPPFLTQLKVAIGRRFPGIIDRLGWGSAEYAQLALVSLRRFIIKEIKHVPNDRAMPGFRSPRAPFMLQVTYPEGFRKLAKAQGSATTPQGWARRMQTMGQMQMWRMIRTLDLRNVDTFPQQLKDMERDLTSPEVFEAFFGMDPNFEWENYLDLLYLSQQGDPDAAFDLTEILTQLKGLDVPVEVKFSADGIVNDLPGSALWEASLAKGLDMSADARRARGTAAGFNMEETLYHGTGADIQVFDLDRSGESAGTPGERAVFLSTDTTEASVYARNAAVAKNGPGAFGQGANIRGANVMPMVIRPGRQIVVTTTTHPILKAQDAEVMLYMPAIFSAIIADARAQGYDTVRFQNVLDSSNVPADQIAVLNPKDIRSVNAAFDPANTNSENVMFSADFADPAPAIDPVMEEAYSKFFNFMRNGLPPDNQGKSFILAAMNDPEVLARKGQRITLEETRMKASNADAMDALMRSRKGDRLTEDEVLAIRDFAETSLVRMLEVGAELVDRPSDPVALAAFNMAVKVHQIVLAEAQNQMAAASRIMNSGRIIAQTNAGVAAALRVDLNDPTASGRLVQLASEMTKLDPTRPGNIRKINRAVEISTWDAWKQLGAATIRFMFLSWPPTHFVNALGNTLVMIGGISDHYIAGLKPGQQDLMEEAAIRWTAMLQAMKHQVEYMDANSQFNPLKPNFSLQFDPVEVSGTNKWGEDQARALSAERIGKLSGGLYKPTSDDPIGAFADFLGYGLSAPSDALGVADDLFKGVNYTIALHGLAFREAREARRAGKITAQQEREHAQKLIEFPPDHIVKGAIAEAQENTFTRPVGQITQLALKGRGMADNLAMFGTLKMPFIITPSNLFSFQFRRMPTGPLFPEWRRNYAAGGKKRALAEAQFAMGSMMLMAGWAAWSMGLLTGAGPEDPEKRKALMDTGWQPFAGFTGGSYVQTNRLDPTMMPFHIGALFAETAANDGWNAKPDADWTELWGLSAIKFGQMMLDKSYLSGVASFIEALGSDGNAAERIGRDYQNSLVSATTPAFLAGIRRIEDPHKRLVDDVFSKYRNRIPVLSNEVPPAYDVFGAPVTYQTGLARVAQIINPFAISSVKDGAVYDEIERLKYIPSIMDKSISFPWAGKTYDIALDERMDIYSEMTGAFGGNEELGIPNFRERLNTMLESDDYKALSDINDPRIEGSKAKFISDYVENARTTIKKRIRFKHHDFLKTEAMKQLGGQTELARGKEAEATESAVTAAYEQLLEQAK